MFPLDALSTLIIFQSNVRKFLNTEATAKWKLTKWRSHRRHIIQNKTPFFEFMIRSMIKRLVIMLSIITIVRNYYIQLFINNLKNDDQQRTTTQYVRRVSKVAECTILSSTCTISNQICPLAVCYACACVREWSGIIRKREAE